MRFTRILLSAVLLGIGTARAADAPAAPSAPGPSNGPALSPSNGLTLDEAIRLALSNNPRVKVQSYSRDIARANLLSAYGRFDPSINFRRSYSQENDPALVSPDTGLRPAASFAQTDNYSLSLDGRLPWGLQYSVGGSAVNSRGTFNAFRDNFSTTGGVSITQPLLQGFGFGANLNGIRLAKADRSIADWQFRQTAIDTITNVIYTFNDLVYYREYLRVYRSSRDSAAKLVQDNEKRVSVGATSEAEVLAARAQLARSEEFILSAQRAVRDTEYALRQLLGDKNVLLSGDLPFSIDPPPPAAFVTVTPADDLKTAFAQRPDYQAMRLGVQRSRINETLARNQLLPRVDFVGNYGYNGNDDAFATSRRMVQNEDYRAYSAGVVVSVPLTFATGRGQARAARLARQQTEDDLGRLEQEIAVSLARAAGQIDTTQKRVQAARLSCDLAEKLLDAEEKKLRAGTGLTFFVLDRQDRLSTAQLSLSSALADHRKALAAYDRELGRTLERYQITLAKE